MCFILTVVITVAKNKHLSYQHTNRADIYIKNSAGVQNKMAHMG